MIADFGVRRARLPRWLSLMGAVLLTVGLTIGVFVMVAPPVGEQLRALTQTLPATLARLEFVFDEIAARVPALATAYPPGQHRILIAFTDQLSDILTGTATRIFGAAPHILALASVLVMAIYLAANPARYADSIMTLVPPRERAFARSVLADLVASMRGWLVGQLINMTILGALMAVGLKLIGVPYWLAFGVLTFAAALVPFFGSIASTILPALVVLGGDGSAGKVIAVLLLGLFVHLFEGNILAPLVMAVEVDLAPVVTMFGILVMGALARADRRARGRARDRDGSTCLRAASSSSASTAPTASANHSRRRCRRRRPLPEPSPVDRVARPQIPHPRPKDSFGPLTSKTANSCIRYTPERVTASSTRAAPARPRSRSSASAGRSRSSRAWRRAWRAHPRRTRC